MEGTDAVTEYQFGQFEQQGAFDFQQFGTAEDVLVLVFDGSFDTNVTV